MACVLAVQVGAVAVVVAIAAAVGSSVVLSLSVVEVKLESVVVVEMCWFSEW